MKEQVNTPEKELNEIKTSNLPDKKFKTMAIRALDNPGRRIDKLSGSFNKKSENITKESIRIKEYNNKSKSTIGNQQQIRGGGRMSWHLEDKEQ